MPKKSKSRKITLPNAVAADRDNWSAESRRILAYMPSYRQQYGDQTYDCYKCGREAVFTAEDQRFTYEIRKAHIHQRRSFCPACFQQWQAVKERIRTCEERWVKDRESLQHDAAFLDGWLALLNQQDKYKSHRSNTAIRNMLGKLLRQWER